MRRLWLPDAMRLPPVLRDTVRAGPPSARHALLINPFYPKDPHASFGKHVLTPSLALTSIAAATPPDWTVRYWDENLLQGPPPWQPFPRVVGITVHLTFAQRAFTLARWFRARGAKVVLGGLHVLSCPDECAPHADAIVIGEGVQVWETVLRDVERGRLQPIYRGGHEHPYRDDPAPRRELLPRAQFLTTTSVIATRGCHNRCGFCYLATDGLHMPYMTREPRQVVQEMRADAQPYAVFVDNNLGSRRDYLHALCKELGALRRIWSAAVSIDITDDPELIRAMALAGCTGVFIGFESLHPDNIAEAHKKSPRPDDYARRVALLHEPWHPGERQLRARLRPRPGRRVRAHPPTGSSRTASSAPRSTSSRPTLARRSSVSCSARTLAAPRTGRGMTLPMSSSSRATWNPNSSPTAATWSVTSGCSSHRSIWRRRPQTRVQCCLTSPCRTSTSARTGCGTG
ncbi:MAG: radical SAM protein [Planctomycetota bacterium]